MSSTATLPHSDSVIQASADTFQSLCGIELRPTEDAAETNDGTLIAVISLVGDLDWSIFLGLPRDTATAVCAQFAGFEIPFESEDMGDAVGELANILAGQTKALLDAAGVKAEISLPSVMRAESLSVLLPRHATTVKYDFDSDLGPLWTGIIADNG